MLNSCANLLYNNGININEKNSLKAAAIMLGAKANYQDGLKDINGCVIPHDSLNILKTDESCVLKNTEQLNKTTNGTLSINPDTQKEQIKRGHSVYPNNGCYYPINSSSDTVNFMNNVGQIIDSKNQQILSDMNEKLQSIVRDCLELDNSILLREKAITDVKLKISEQKITCKTQTSQPELTRAPVPVPVESKYTASLPIQAVIPEDNEWKSIFMLKYNNLCVNFDDLEDFNPSLKECDPNNIYQQFYYDPKTRKIIHPTEHDRCLQGNIFTSSWNVDPTQQYIYKDNMFNYQNDTCLGIQENYFTLLPCSDNPKLDRVFLNKPFIKSDKGNVIVIGPWNSITTPVWEGSKNNSYWISNSNKNNCTFSKEINILNDMTVKIYFKSYNNATIYINNNLIRTNHDKIGKPISFSNIGLTQGTNMIKIDVTGNTVKNILFSMYNTNTGIEVVSSDESWYVN